MVATFESYDRVISLIGKYIGSTISVPELSHLLDVKPTTLNARFRRQQAEVITLGRTNYVSCDLALRLAQMHKYALLGWPTLQEASRLTNVKDVTIKARCEKGKVEGYLDLTKRLRINPAQLKQLSLDLHKPKCREIPSPLKTAAHIELDRATIPPGNRRGTNGVSRQPPGAPPLEASEKSTKQRVEGDDGVSEVHSFLLPPAPEPKLVLITNKDYGLPAAGNESALERSKPNLTKKKSKRSGYLDYDPDRPFSISDCSIGKAIRYGQYFGTVLKVIDDSFNPKIKVAFPNHQESLMREVLLMVERRRK